LGVREPIISGVKPTTLITISGRAAAAIRLSERQKKGMKLTEQAGEF
jgi:hypothetical protein